jgi:hypothetical protein
MELEQGSPGITRWQEAFLKHSGPGRYTMSTLSPLWLTSSCYCLQKAYIRLTGTPDVELI